MSRMLSCSQMLFLDSKFLICSLLPQWKRDKGDETHSMHDRTLAAFRRVCPLVWSGDGAYTLRCCKTTETTAFLWNLDVMTALPFNIKNGGGDSLSALSVKNNSPQIKYYSCPPHLPCSSFPIWFLKCASISMDFKAHSLEFLEHSLLLRGKKKRKTF